MIPAESAGSSAAPIPDSAFPKTMRAMRESHGNSDLDADSFSRRLSRCDISDCGGQCCTEGTSLGDEEVKVLTELVRRERGFFESHGVHDPERHIQSSGRAGAGGRTLVRERLDSEVAADFPVRFGHAACSFLADGGRCSFQMLSMERGRAPWWWKPVRCRLHPVSLGGHRIGLSVREGSAGDTVVNPDVTRCGRVMPGGSPASELLAEELDWLGEVLGRNLHAELALVTPDVPAHGLEGPAEASVRDGSALPDVSR